ncbi:hypothetical protein NLJ89_g9055 [Agrocybe chaxingu]|uniref:Uncharacterized protein n=1 Tax=Agrocybe chaxingu TaxID=84603 RepID=A0A9W8MTH8_9AGAR|nr:hypothetical protein NLJ89_g9055 [Agrocybe chaxingu]
MPWGASHTPLCESYENLHPDARSLPNMTRHAMTGNSSTRARRPRYSQMRPPSSKVQKHSQAAASALKPSTSTRIDSIEYRHERPAVESPALISGAAYPRLAIPESLPEDQSALQLGIFPMAPLYNRLRQPALGDTTASNNADRSLMNPDPTRHSHNGPSHVDVLHLQTARRRACFVNKRSAEPPEAAFSPSFQQRPSLQSPLPVPDQQSDDIRCVDKREILPPVVLAHGSSAHVPAYESQPIFMIELLEIIIYFLDSSSGIVVLLALSTPSLVSLTSSQSVIWRMGAHASSYSTRLAPVRLLCPVCPFTFSKYPSPMILPANLIQLFMILVKYARPGRHICPNLRRLSVPQQSPSNATFSILTPLMSPNLEDVYITIPNESTKYMQQLVQGAPGILRLRIAGFISGDALLHLSLFPRLRRLSIIFEEDVTPTNHSDQERTLQSLHLPPSLSTFRFNCVKRFTSPFLAHFRDLFLKNVSVRGSSGDIASNLAMTSGLEGVTLEFSDRAEVAPDVSSCFAALSNLSKDTLRSVVVESHNAPPWTISIQPLLSFPGIQSLEVHNYHPHELDLTDNLLSSIVKAWPKLTHLVFAAINTSCLTSASLEILSKLPNLRILRLPLKTTIVELPLNPAPIVSKKRYALNEELRRLFPHAV